jgi:hypothetical protein
MPLYGDAEAEMDLSVYDRSWPLVGGQSGRIYASVVRQEEDDILALNYWFHYPRSNWGEHGGANTHEGDWEGVTLFFARSGQPGSGWVPEEVAFGQHVRLFGGISDSVDGGNRVAWRDVEREQEHVVVYVSLGGHASYSNRGITKWIVPCGLLADEFHTGEVVPSTHQLAYLPQVGSGPISIGGSAPDWLLYCGFWGSRDLPAGWNPLCNLGIRAPRGPVYLGGGEARPGQRWLNPWRWAELFGDPPALVQDYAAWAAGAFGPTDVNTGPEDDFSGDGISNRLAQLLGLNPKENNSGEEIRIVGAIDGSWDEELADGVSAIEHREIRVQTRQSKTADSRMVGLSASADLKSWSKVETVDWLVVGEDTTAWLLETRLPVEAGGERFYRVRFESRD